MLIYFLNFWVSIKNVYEKPSIIVFLFADKKCMTNCVSNTQGLFTYKQQF